MSNIIYAGFLARRPEAEIVSEEQLSDSISKHLHKFKRKACDYKKTVTTSSSCSEIASPPASFPCDAAALAVDMEDSITELLGVVMYVLISFGISFLEGENAGSLSVEVR